MISQKFPKVDNGSSKLLNNYTSIYRLITKTTLQLLAKYDCVVNTLTMHQKEINFLQV